MKNIYVALLFFISTHFSQAQIIDIPDAGFKDVLTTGADRVDTNRDGEIQITEAEAVKSLFLQHERINSLEGIQYFTNLEFLDCSNNFIETLDLRNNVLLTDVRCDFNELTSIDVTQNLELRQLICNQNDIANLDITNNLELRSLNGFGNPFNANLDTSFNINLMSFSGRSIDLSNNVNLRTLRTDDKGLTSLDMSQAPNLRVLFITGSSNSTLTSLNVRENVLLEELSCSSLMLSSLDVSNNPNLTYLNCGVNQITELDLTNNINLKTLYFGSNQLTTIDLTNNINLDLLSCESNQLTDLDISQNVNLEQLYVNDNRLTSLSVNNNESITRLDSDNNQLSKLFLKNESITKGSSILKFNGNPNLTYVCVVESKLDKIQEKIDSYGYTNCTAGTHCPSKPLGNQYIISGTSKVDTNNNGCDIEDLPYPYLKYDIEEVGSQNFIGSFIGNDLGRYTIPSSEGGYIISPRLLNPDYYTISPRSVRIDFPKDSSPYNQEFCVTVNGAKNDLEIVIIPAEQARPGFYTNYELIFFNSGNVTLSGTVTLDFQDDFMDIVIINPIASNKTDGNLSWNYSDLLPSERRRIKLQMNINTPTDPNFPVNGDDILNFKATINPVPADETPENNVFELDQRVVNSYDPNDKTCLEGSSIAPDEVGNYVHYLIRFENTGTASAVNIVVKDVIDTSKLDISTLLPISGSHDFTTKITENNIVEFVFEDINLPHEDDSNDGYVSFKIKTLFSLNLGDTFGSEAEIYFDFNAPIITNTPQTTVEEPTLSIIDANLGSQIKLYPNPVNDILHIESKLPFETVSIYDINGRMLNTVTSKLSVSSKKIDFQDFTKGIYFLKIDSKNEQFIEKIIKN